MAPSVNVRPAGLVITVVNTATILAAIDKPGAWGACKCLTRDDG